MKIIKPGLLTTIQDAGRNGWQRYGVVVGGVMDSLSFRIANRLLGNPEGLAVLEITLQGPTIQFEEFTYCVLTGADLSPRLNSQTITLYRPFPVHPGDELSFNYPNIGCRTYLAVSGGFVVAEVLGSRSTYLRSAMGGYKGRKLQEGDRLQSGTHEGMDQLCNFFQFSQTKRYPLVSQTLNPSYQTYRSIRFLPGPEWHLFNNDAQKQWQEQSFLVMPQSDRMGYRLQGPPIQLTKAEEMLSSAVTMGTVQVPSDGQPIILMADRQTTGGYPRLAQIITADLPVLAQVRPGDKLRFQLCSLEEARSALMEQERQLANLFWALEWYKK